MNLKSGIVLLFILVITLVVLLPLLVGASITELPEEDDLTDDDLSIISNFSVAWIRIPVHQLSILLRVGLSIFTLFVVYLGGRSKHRRFNDRTIDHVRALIADSLKTAHIRAVFHFNFLFTTRSGLHRFPVDRHFYPTLIPNRRSNTL